MSETLAAISLFLIVTHLGRHYPTLCVLFLEVIVAHSPRSLHSLLHAGPSATDSLQLLRCIVSGLVSVDSCSFVMRTSFESLEILPPD